MFTIERAGRRHRGAAGPAQGGRGRRTADPPAGRRPGATTPTRTWPRPRPGSCLLEWGIPLSALLDLARRHHQATEAVAREAVAMFSAHVRRPLRAAADADDGRPATDGDPTSTGLLQAYAELLPAVNTLVGHHFTRTLVSAALDHVERVGSDGRACGPSGSGRRRRRPGSRRSPGRPSHEPTRLRPVPPVTSTGRLARRRPRTTSPPARRRPVWCGRCSTPSPPATTWSTA